MVKDQNTSLALELGGFEFKPHINEHSKKLSVSMKKLCTRIDEIQSERERFLLQKKKESDEAEVAGCTFEPTRYSEKTSDLYLRRMGREEKVKPEDLFKYQQDKMRRNELRRQILREIEEKELTFKPALNEKTIKIQVSHDIGDGRSRAMDDGCVLGEDGATRLDRCGPGDEDHPPHSSGSVASGGRQSEQQQPSPQPHQGQGQGWHGGSGRPYPGGGVRPSLQAQHVGVLHRAGARGGVLLGELLGQHQDRGHLRLRALLRRRDAHAPLRQRQVLRRVSQTPP